MSHTISESSAKLRSAQRFAAGLLGELRHERQVYRNAVSLFNLTDSYHDLTPEHLDLLKWGAILHDVGRSVEAKRHPVIGAKMILRDRRLPITDVQRRQLAYLARYHRGAVPPAGMDEILKPGDGRKPMRRVLALLRAADTLDSRSMRSPRIRMSLRGNTLNIFCLVRSDAEKAQRAFTRVKKFRLLKELFDLKVNVRVIQRRAKVASR